MTEKSNNRYYIKVVVPLPLPNLFTYSVPDTLISQIEIGKRVLIQFGSQKIYAAIVIETPVEKSDDYEVKPIISIIDEMPVVTEKSSQRPMDTIRGISKVHGGVIEITQIHDTRESRRPVK